MRSSFHLSPGSPAQVPFREKMSVCMCVLYYKLDYYVILLTGLGEGPEKEWVGIGRGWMGKNSNNSNSADNF